MAPACALKRFVRRNSSVGNPHSGVISTLSVEDLDESNSEEEFGNCFPMYHKSRNEFHNGESSKRVQNELSEDENSPSSSDLNEQDRFYHNLIVNEEEAYIYENVGFQSSQEFPIGSTDIYNLESGFSTVSLEGNCGAEEGSKKLLGKKSTFLPRIYDKAVFVASGGKRRTYRVALLTTILPGGTMSSEGDGGLINRYLPKELVLRVFSYLDVVELCRSAQVCKHWNMLALDGSNWQKVNLFSFQRDIKGQVVENLSKRCGGFLKELSLFGCENVQDGALNTFAEKCHSIEDLNLRKCKRITDSTCDSLGRHCKRLRTLILDGCSAITENGLKAVSEGCNQLEVLDISWCNGILDDGLEAVGRGCPQLRALHAKGCQGISDTGIKHISTYCTNLRVANFHSCSQLTDQTAAYLAECHNLEYISLSNCVQLTDRALHSIAQGCHLLKDLEVACCAQLTDNGFSSLAKNCHDLERMDMEDCSLTSDATLTTLATGCPHLTALSLSHCELITDEGIRQLALSLAHQERLRVLELDNCPLITDASLEHLRECRTLEKVDLYDCQLITRQGIRRLKHSLPHVAVHAYFAPQTPPVQAQSRRQGFCRCCSIL